MADSNSNSSNEPIFRRSRPLSRRRHHQSPRRALPEVTIHVESPKGLTATNDVVIIDIYDEETGREEHTTVACSEVDKETLQIAVDCKNIDAFDPESNNQNSLLVQIQQEALLVPLPTQTGSQKTLLKLTASSETLPVMGSSSALPTTSNTIKPPILTSTPKLLSSSSIPPQGSGGSLNFSMNSSQPRLLLMKSKLSTVSSKPISKVGSSLFGRFHKKSKPKRTKALAPLTDDDEDDWASLPVISSSCGGSRRRGLWTWGDEIDTQDVASDTQDLQRLMPQAQFILNFRHYDEEEINVHVGLRSKKYLQSNLFLPPNTDDYHREFFRYLKTQEKLQKLKLILEVHVEDDIHNYKVFDDDDNNEQVVGPFASKTQLQYPVIKSNLGIFWNIKTIPVGISFVHVEVPGLGVLYLNDWKRLLEMQLKLATLICNFGSVLWTFYAKIVKNNEKTLEKVVLRRIISYDVRNKRQVPFDFGILQRAYKLKYLKVTGGGYKNRWGYQEGQDQQEEELLLHVNFELLPVEAFEELHYNYTDISKRKLQELIIRCNDKNLQLICAECPDCEYYDGDWEVTNPEDTEVINVDASSTELELEMLFNGTPTARKRLEMYKARQEKRTNIIMLLLILCLIAFIGMTVAVGVAIYYSNKEKNTSQKNI